MKITKVKISNFKRFQEETFEFGDSVVVAGPNNSGKTTLLQAIATWSLVLARWRELNNYRRSGRGGTYSSAPLARQAFYAVPLRAFDLLWKEYAQWGVIEIEITLVTKNADSFTVPVEVIADSSEQVYVRPKKNTEPDVLREIADLPQPVFVPAMTGLGTEEPVYQPPKIQQLLGQGKPGDVLRNLLGGVHQEQKSWERLTDSIQAMFGYELLPPNTGGAHILAEYRENKGGRNLDIASAGSGFLQVLMLLTFMHSRQGAVLLLDEPDAHLHVILQDQIYAELGQAARASNSQLIIATHSEVVIDSVDPRQLCSLLGAPTKLVDTKEKAALIRSLSALTNTDIMLAREKGRVIYVEGSTDIAILQEWARVLDHRVSKFLIGQFWRPTVSDVRQKGKGIKAHDHFESLLQVHAEMRGTQLFDRDGKPGPPPKETKCDGKLLKLYWDRYEIESYLVHPAALARFVATKVGETAPLANLDSMKVQMKKLLPGDAVDNPLDKNHMFDNTKMRDSILPAILDAAGISDFPYTRYAEIAAVMLPAEIHPEIVAKLDAIADHFGL
ncbi:MAG: AAA family ATPase [Gammaproteobacteria bacterium]|nr:AAA family ATPase [Gammaproteobacteria bacterium]